VKLTSLILLALFIIGCNNTQNDDNKSIINHTKIEHNATNEISKALLQIDTNDTIQITPQSIQTNMCETNQTIIINIFAPWAKSSISQLAILDLLKQKHNTCILSIALDSNKTATNVSNINHKVIFSLQNNDFVDKITHMIKIDKNFKLPLNLIYKNTRFIDSYQGVMPYEMLEYIIKG
jgi:hypothetical protein